MQTSKVTIDRQDDYVITRPQSPLSDREFSQLHDDITRSISDYKVKGVLIDLKNMDVLDSFATRILHNIAKSTSKKEVPFILYNIHSDILRVMNIQGLDLMGINKAEDLTGGLKLLEKHNE